MNIWWVVSSPSLLILHMFLASETHNPSGVNKVLKRKSETKMVKEEEACRPY